MAGAQHGVQVKPVTAEPVADKSSPESEPDLATPGVPPYLALLQRKCSACSEDDDKPRETGHDPLLQRDAAVRGSSRSTANRPDPGAPPGGNGNTAIRAHGLASAGVAGASRALPGLSRIQRAFGSHDISGVRVQVGGVGAQAAARLGARAYTLGNRIAFRDSPDLHLAAHEAAHVVQQRAGIQLEGGVGRAGDLYEQHADAVADAVVAGHSAEALLDAVRPRTAARAGAGNVVQMACACGGTCDRCAAELQPERLQFELDPEATREFEPVARSGKSAAGGGAGHGKATGGKADGGAASGAAGGGGDAATPAGPAAAAPDPGAGAAAAAPAAGGTDPVSAAAAQAGAERCPEIAEAEAAEGGPEPEPQEDCTEESAHVDHRNASQKSEDAEKQKKGEPPPDEPAPVQATAKGQSKSEVKDAPAGGQAPPEPAPPAECKQPDSKEGGGPPPASAAEAAAEPAAATPESPFDPAREEAILVGEAGRGQAVADLDLATEGAAAAGSRLRAQAISSVRFAAPGPEPGAELAHKESSAVASRAVADGVASARATFDLLRAEVPQRVAAKHSIP